jgi:hypothetical protein
VCGRLRLVHGSATTAERPRARASYKENWSLILHRSITWIECVRFLSDTTLSRCMSLWGCGLFYGADSILKRGEQTLYLKNWIRVTGVLSGPKEIRAILF